MVMQIKLIVVVVVVDSLLAHVVSGIVFACVRVLARKLQLSRLCLHYDNPAG